MEGKPKGLPQLVAPADLLELRPGTDVGNYRRSHQQSTPLSSSHQLTPPSSKKGAKFSSPEPTHRPAQHDGISNRRNRALHLSLPNLPSSARIVEGEFPGNFVLLHPNVPKTPQTLYRSQFQPVGKERRISNDGRESPGRNEAVSRKTIFDNDGGTTARRPCQEVEMRMPLCYSHGEHSLTLDVLSQLVGKESTIPRSKDLMRPIVGIALNEKPTSRLQAQMLAVWFGNQISCLANRGAGMAPPPLVVDGQIVNAPVAEILPDVSSLSKLGTEEAEMLMALWDLESLPRVPFVIGHPIGQQIRVEGVKLPNDRRYLQAMLQVCGTAAAAVTQQVAMHCHERGKLLSSVWNLSVGLMEFEAESLRKQIDAVTEESLNRNHMAASKEELRAAKYKIKELEQKNRESENTIEVLRKHNKEMKKELEHYRGAGAEAAEKQQDKIEELEYALAVAKEGVEQGQSQLDVTFTCFHAATTQAKKLRDHVQELEDRLWEATWGDSEQKVRLGGMQHCFENGSEGDKDLKPDLKDLMSVSLKNLRGQAEEITDLEGFLEQEIRLSAPGTGGKDAYNPYHALERLMKVKTQNLLPVEVLQDSPSMKLQNQSGAGSPTREISLSGGLTAEQSAQSLHSSRIAADAAQEKFEETKKALTELASEALAADPGTVLEPADMEDADEMKRDEMWDEIKRLREKGKTLLILIKVMQEQYEKVAEVEARLKRAISHINSGEVDKAATLVAEASRDSAPGLDGEQADGTKEPAGEGDGANGAPEDAQKDALPAYLENTGFSSVTAFLSKLATAVVKVTNEESQAEETKQKKKAQKSKKKGNNSADASAATEAAMEEARIEALKCWSGYSSMADGESASGDGVKLTRPSELFGGLFRALGLSGDNDSSDTGAAAARVSSGVSEEAAALATNEHTRRSASTLSQASPLSRVSSIDPAKSSDIPSQRPAKLHVGVAIQEQQAPPVTPGKRGTPTSVTRARNMMNRNQSIKRIAKAVGKVAAATATPMPTFFCKNQMLKDAMQKNVNSDPRSPEWALKVIEGTYKRIGVQEAKSTKDIFEATSIPEALMTHFSSQYGAKKIVQEYVAGMVATLRKFSNTHPPLNIFNKFLSEDWNNLILSYFLEATNLAAAKGSVPTPCVEYPDPKNRGTRYICTRKAIAISEHVLGGRSPEATEKFEKRLMARSEGGLTGNDMSYFWSPAQGDSLEAEVARNGPMAKIIFHDFMTLLCTEAERLESNMLDLLPQLFREMDTSHNGHLTRRDFNSMLDACFNDIPDAAFRLARLSIEKDTIWKLAESFTAMEHQGGDDIDAEGVYCRNDISFKGFMHAVERSDLFRIYMRFRRCEAAPDEVDTNTAHSKDKTLYLSLQRCWESFSNCWEYLKENENSQIAAKAYHIIGLGSKLPNEVSGEKKAALHVKLLQELLEHKLDEIKSLAKQTSSDSDLNSMETLLLTVQQSVKVAYGYQALLEDDIDIFKIMLDREAPLGMRKRASSHWRQQVAFLTTYRRDAEDHATAVVKTRLAEKFGKRLLNFHRRISVSDDDKPKPRTMRKANLSSGSAFLAALMERVNRNDPAEVRRMLANEEADVNAADYDARTALHVAASAGSLEMVKSLCDFGANVNAIDNWSGSPIDDAIRNGHLSTAEELATRGSKVGSQENAGAELMKAITKGDVGRASLLLTAGTSPDTHHYDNRYAIHIAVAKGHADVVSLLIKSGASLDAKDNFGYTPLDEASRHAALLHDNTIVDILLSHGAPYAKGAAGP